MFNLSYKSEKMLYLFVNNIFKSLYKQKPSPVGEGVEAVYKVYLFDWFAAETDEVV